LNNFDVKDHGGADWFYNILLQLFEGEIKDSLTQDITQEAVAAINTDLNKLLQTIPMKQSIENFVIDYELVAPPIIGANYVGLPGKGVFSTVTNPSPPPFPPRTALPDLTNANVMAQFFLSDYVANTLFYSLYKAGILDYTLNNNNLPAGFPVKFNTNAFEFLVPSLYFKYPGLNMTANFVPQQSPMGTITAAGADIAAQYSAAFFVIQKNNTVTPVFTLGVVLDTVAVVSIGAGNTVQAQIKSGAVTFSILSSDIGNFTVSALQVIANTAINNVIIPEVNTGILAKGIAIPLIDGIALVSPTIASGPGYFVVSSNVHYQPTAKNDFEFVGDVIAY
jgi:hypothetical protein